MSEPEAEQFGIPPDARKSYMRPDKAKANIVRAVKARWLRLMPVLLGNADAVYIDATFVGKLEVEVAPDHHAA